MKIFISMPMNGRTEQEIIERMERIKKIILSSYSADSIEFIDTIHHENSPENAGRLWHLGKSIQQLDQANLVYFTYDWDYAYGCKVERVVCEAYDKDYILLSKQIEDEFTYKN